MKETLCWKCNKTCGGCSWTRDYKPVEGWTAKKCYIKQNVGYEESYMVLDCPEFELLKSLSYNEKFSYEEYFAFKRHQAQFSDNECALLELYYTTARREMLKRAGGAERTVCRKIHELRERVKKIQREEKEIEQEGL